MVQRLLLDRVDAEAGRPAVADEPNLVVEALAHVAQAALTLTKMAVPGAQIALELTVLKRVPILRRNNRRFHGQYIGAHVATNNSRGDGMTSRAPAVAGFFYPGDPAALAAEVRSYLDDSPDREDIAAPKAVIVPHAGYRYSGAIAAQAFRSITNVADRVSRVVLLGPAHRVYLEGIAVPDADAFDFPGGSIPLDTDALSALESLPDVVVSNEAHAEEHCLEVQLPFLAAVLGEFTLVPFVVGRAAPHRVAAALEAVWGGPETLVVVSSDLSHYMPYDDAVDIDNRTAAHIAERAVDLDGHAACGAHAINGLMVVARERGLVVDVLDVRNSGDTAGDRSRVVGYGAFTLH